MVEIRISGSARSDAYPVQGSQDFGQVLRLRIADRAQMFFRLAYGYVFVLTGANRPPESEFQAHVIPPAFASHAIQVRLPDVSARGADVLLVLVVRKKDDDVWPLSEEALRNQEGETRAGDSLCLNEVQRVGFYPLL